MTTNDGGPAMPGDDDLYISRELLLAAFEGDEPVFEKIRAMLLAFPSRALPAATPRPMGEAPRDDFDLLIADARQAAEKAMVRFPQPNYVISKIAEEAGEVVKAAIHCAEGRETAENLRGEMVQAIAMLYRLWMEGDGVHGLPAVRGSHPAAPEDKA